MKNPILGRFAVVHVYDGLAEQVWDQHGNMLVFQAVYIDDHEVWCPVCDTAVARECVLWFRNVGFCGVACLAKFHVGGTTRYQYGEVEDAIDIC